MKQLKHPVFLGLDEVIAIHRDQIARYGGILGLRSPFLLRSALARPSASYGGQYLYRGLPEMAAAYFFHILAKYPFMDGNKRTAAVAALVFLELNGLEISTSDDEFEKIIWSAAEKKIEKSEIEAFFRKCTKLQ